MTKNFDLQDDTEFAYEVKKYKCMYGKAYKLAYCLLPKPNFLRLDFFLFSLRSFDNVLKIAFLNFLFFTAMLSFS